jgi:hypothetical protein
MSIFPFVLFGGALAVSYYFWNQRIKQNAANMAATAPQRWGPLLQPGELLACEGTGIEKNYGTGMFNLAVTNCGRLIVMNYTAGAPTSFSDVYSYSLAQTRYFDIAPDGLRSIDEPRIEIRITDGMRQHSLCGCSRSIYEAIAHYGFAPPLPPEIVAASQVRNNPVSHLTRQAAAAGKNAMANPAALLKGWGLKLVAFAGLVGAVFAWKMCSKSAEYDDRKREVYALCADDAACKQVVDKHFDDCFDDSFDMGGRKQAAQLDTHKFVRCVNEHAGEEIFGVK